MNIKKIKTDAKTKRKNEELVFNELVKSRFNSGLQYIVKNQHLDCSFLRKSKDSIDFSEAIEGLIQKGLISKKRWEGGFGEIWYILKTFNYNWYN